MDLELPGLTVQFSVGRSCAASASESLRAAFACVALTAFSDSSDLLKLSEITDRAAQIQEGLNRLSPAAVEKQIKDNDAQIKALQKEIEDEQKSKS